MTDPDHWVRYYAVTAERPAWGTLRRAIELFAAEPVAHPRLAVDLGCGAGRDTRELLRAGWRVIAIDREAAALDAVAAAPEARGDGGRLETRLADLADVELPTCDLVNASVSLPFLAPDAFWATWGRVLAALPVGGRFAAMLFGDRDESASDASMTCPAPATIRSALAGFELEQWDEREEDSRTALGEPHHLHLVEFVARRTTRGWI